MSETEDYAGAAVSWDQVTGKPTEFAPEAHKNSHEIGGGDEIEVSFILQRFNRVARCMSSDLSTLKDLRHAGNTFRVEPENLDWYLMEFYCDGLETKLHIGTYGLGSTCKWDLFVNTFLDSSGYDDYLPTAASIYRHITLTKPIVRGYNLILLHCNGKNNLSTGYQLFVYGASLQ